MTRGVAEWLLPVYIKQQLQRKLRQHWTAINERQQRYVNNS